MLARILASLSFLAVICQAQLHVVVEQKYGGAGDTIGAAVACAGDVDRDGVDDWIYGGPEDGGGNGVVRVVSGRTGANVWSKTGSGGQLLGQGVAGDFDADADGTPDFAGGWNIHDASGNGGFIVWSGATGAVLFQFQSFGGLGLALDTLDDIDGDGRDELLAGRPMLAPIGGPSQAGQVLVFELNPGSTTPTLEHSILGAEANGRLGTCVTSAGDIDGDGVEDFAAGEPGHLTFNGGFTQFTGRIRVYSGMAAAQGATVVLRDFMSDPFGRMGNSVDGGHDVDGDQVPDVIGGAESSLVTVFSGAGGGNAIIHNFQPPGGTAPSLGHAVALLGDADGDGRSEFAMGLPFDGGGDVRVHDGASGAMVAQFDADGPADQTGHAVGACDVNGDGIRDVMVGSPREFPPSSAVGPVPNGAVRIYSIAPRTEVTPVYLGDYVVARLTDVDGDHRPEFAVANAHPTINPATITVHSGVTTAPLFTATSPEIGDLMGTSLAPIGDIDGDGVDDILAGAPRADHPGGADTGAVRVISGSFGLVAYTAFAGPWTNVGNEHGAAVAALGDLTGDGVPEFAAGAPMGSLSPASGQNGVVLIHDGSNGAVIAAHGGAAAGDEFGAALATLEDLDGDGFRELAVGSPGAGGGAGAVTVLRGNTLAGAAQTLFSYAGFGDEALGTVVADAGDVDADGVGDLVAGAPLYDSLLAPDRGRARVLSGAGGAVLLTTYGEAGGDRYGSAVSWMGDVDLDGRDDFAVTATRFDGPSFDIGRLYVHAGSNGRVIARYQGTTTTNYGYTMAGLGDRDGDGFVDLVAARDTFSGNIKIMIDTPVRYPGLEAYGVGTPGCDGPVLLTGNTPPTVGNQAFAVIVNGGPALDTGFLMVSDPTARLTGGVDLFGLGLDFHIDVINAPYLLVEPMSTNATGHASLAAPLPNIPAIAGFRLVMQAVFYEGPCSPAIYSTTNGFEMTIL